MKLAGKVAIVTGGASGIGEETARRFAKQGARAVVIADVQDELGREVASSICRPITKSVYVHCDVTQEDQLLGPGPDRAGPGPGGNGPGFGGQREGDRGVCEARGEGDGGRAREGWEHRVYSKRGRVHRRERDGGLLPVEARGGRAGEVGERAAWGARDQGELCVAVRGGDADGVARVWRGEGCGVGGEYGRGEYELERCGAEGGTRGGCGGFLGFGGVGACYGA
ncbi:unnamed protein product [Linum tenue]|uniref:Uncharacterized protein n=1 Tax=Linum tenue TaxID=586396 RepID=A0AAV0INU9_9ROSI|nr:unnamed protein product [Linum tenue]